MVLSKSSSPFKNSDGVLKFTRKSFRPVANRLGNKIISDTLYGSSVTANEVLPSQ